MKGAYPSYATTVPETGNVHLITLRARDNAPVANEAFSKKGRSDLQNDRQFIVYVTVCLIRNLHQRMKSSPVITGCPVN
jgi:hypothetical protein